MVSIGGKTYQADEWSYGGFLLNTDTTNLPLGTLVNIDSVGKAPKSLMAVGIRARVSRVTDDGSQVALSCLHLDDDAYRALADLGQ